ncbi:Glycine cleavage system transcriptional activator [Rhodocyclaceae bacterium]|jgi:DNA-binding transcriptional LysR family regulator|nr:Glycine cleavage system transcriptional activator [Rhodocyclaceae bacterium]
MGNPSRLHFSLDLLKGFEAAARHLSFTSAANELSLTQSAISREIKLLESRLEVRLFNRIHRGLELTDAGLALYRSVSEALRLIDRGIEAVTEPAGGVVTITTNVPFASFWVVPRLPRFAALYPDISVRVAATNRVVNLEREQIDVGVRHISGGTLPPGAIELMTERLFPVCAPQLLRRRDRPLKKPEDLARHTLLLFSPEDMPQHWSDWPRWFEAMKLAGPAPAATLSFGHYDQVIQAALDGAGVALGRNLLVQRHLDGGTLVAPFGQDRSVAIGGRYVVTTAAHAVERPSVRVFVDWLLGEAATG